MPTKFQLFLKLLKTEYMPAGKAKSSKNDSNTLNFSPAALQKSYFLYYLLPKLSLVFFFYDCDEKKVFPHLEYMKNDAFVHGNHSSKAEYMHPRNRLFLKKFKTEYMLTGIYGH